MIHFIETIITTKIPIYWATILSDNLDEKLILVNNDPHFYMTSYMLYLLVERTIDYPGLYRKRSMQGSNAWPYVMYSQLIKKISH